MPIKLFSVYWNLSQLETWVKYLQLLALFWVVLLWRYFQMSLQSWSRSVCATNADHLRWSVVYPIQIKIIPANMFAKPMERCFWHPLARRPLTAVCVNCPLNKSCTLFLRSLKPINKKSELLDTRKPLTCILHVHGSDGCLSDVTGAGTALLAVYLRWVLDPPPDAPPVHLQRESEKTAMTLWGYTRGIVLLTAIFVALVLRRTFAKLFSHLILCSRKLLS